MATVKFDSQDELDELQAKIYLDTKIKLTKKEILELFFKYGKTHYNEIIQELNTNQEELTDEDIDDILNSVSDWGKGTENLSENVDEVIYGSKKSKGNSK